MAKLFLVFLIFIISCQTRHENELVIQNVHIVDVESGAILEQYDVFIDEGFITEIRPAEDGAAAARVIDGSGKYLIPGLWDMHVHFRGGEELVDENRNLLPLYIANGITTVRDGGGDITPAVLEWIGRIESGELIGPKIFTSGPKLDGPNPGWAGSIELDSMDQIPAALDSLESLGVDYVKIYDSSLSGELFLAIIDESVKRGLPVTGHMPFELMFEETVERGLSATEHIFYAFKGSSPEEERITGELIERRGTDNPMGMREALAGIMNSRDQNHAASLYQKMIEHETGIIPTLHIMDVLANLKNRDHSGDEYLSYIGPGIRETYQRRLQAALRAPDGQLNIYDLPGYDSMIADMANSGVRIYAGSDAGPFNTFVYPGISLHKELQLLVDAGLTPLQALQTATLNPPAFFNLQNSFGKVNQGFVADLLLLDANPLDEISNTQQIYKVIRKGDVIYDSDFLKNLLKELELKYNH